MKSIFTSFLILGIFTSKPYAQETTLSTGADYSNSNGSISFSIGQTTFNSNENTSGLESQGIQQPFEIYLITNSIKDQSIYDISLYPNPTTDQIFLETKSSQDQIIQIQLYNMEGKLILNNEINDEKAKIDFSNYTSGQYLIKIKNSNNKTQSFNIIKN